MTTSIDNPILNSPYEPPDRHYEIGPIGPTGVVLDGRRPSESFIPIAVSKKGTKDESVQEEIDFDVTGERREKNSLINDIRRDVEKWRRGGHYDGVTPITRKLLQYWADPDRENRVIFAQREAAETAIFLTEVAGRGAWTDWRKRLEPENTAHNDGLPRAALKMATGAGKTVVMAMLIAWQTLNKAHSRATRDSDSAREVEVIKAFRDTWELGVNSYLTYLRDRLLAARELLTDSGSCFVQIGDENVHLVRALMDEVFGADNVISQITMQKTAGQDERLLNNNADYILWFAKNKVAVKFRPIFVTKKNVPDAGYSSVEFADGTRRGLTKDEVEGLAALPAGARFFQAITLTSSGHGGNTAFPFEFDGKTYLPTANRHWSTHADGLARLATANRIHAGGGKALRYIRYLDDFLAVPLGNVWTGTAFNPLAESKIYVVQTAARVLERCAIMCTDPGDLILDPTCGSGTSAFVAEQWGRRWITIDSSRVALSLARQRLMAARYPWYLLADSFEGQTKETELSASAIPRHTYSADVRQGFVYQRMQHVTLKDIANNPDIKEGMNRAEIGGAIMRHADFELLYDKPFQDNKKVRVAGPFTVESLSPHRSLSFGDLAETIGETEAAKDADSPNFEQSILENLAKAGIQNGKRAEKLKFEAFETYAGQFMQAIGQQPATEDSDAPKRIAIAIGPQYGTVSASFVKKAAREALNAEGIDLLAILGFAFDPQVTSIRSDDGDELEVSGDGFANVEGVRKLGRLPVLMVRMNADLLMGEELKKTGSGNLFTVFGEPDIEVKETEEGLIVDLKGVDVYDPTTGEVRSSDTGQIALWMIDTEYNEESFFVRHCYFTGGNDPYKRLRTALKADIDEEAWESLYQTVSRPFPKPETGKIAIKVINDYGDEVMKVFEVA